MTIEVLPSKSQVGNKSSSGRMLLHKEGSGLVVRFSILSSMHEKIKKNKNQRFSALRQTCLQKVVPVLRI